MEIFKAEVKEQDKEHFLVLEVKANALMIPITQDLPKEVKNVFNQLLAFLKEGCFKFDLKKVENGDIYYHISSEYIFQLNKELEDIYKEMKELGLVAVEK